MQDSTALAGWRPDSRRASGVSPYRTVKWPAVQSTARIGRPAAAAVPIAAVSQIVAAVVSPRTEPRCTKIRPAPMNPSPETICAATRDGSTTTWPGTTTFWKPYLLTRRNRADPRPTIVCVRSPADFCRSCRSSPIVADSTKARASSPTCVQP